jgi:SMC interacting uncharacterized protein involved in chromosome segregation
MENLIDAIGENWQPALVAIAVLATAIKAAWDQWQRRQVVQHGKETAAKENEINEQAYRGAVEGLQEINEAKEEQLKGAEQSVQVLRNALEEKKQISSAELQNNQEELLKRLTKITGARRVK